ncbi:MAG TPA: hypothetical protein VL307_08065 [Chitinophagaceae bacterium]|nr:hypothetical protein [Chitinophagaceae bacterium]
MTQTFDARRWWLLVTKHWSENKKKYSLSLLAFSGLLLLWWIFIVMDNHRAPAEDIQINAYYVVLFILGCLYASTLFADLGSKTKALNYLTVPASQAEKILCNLFYGVLVFFVCYTAIFYILDFVVVKAGNAMAYNRWLQQHDPRSVFKKETVANVFSGPSGLRDKGFSLYLLLLYFVLQSAFIYGSIYFSKFSFIKTVIALVLVGVFVSVVLAKLISPILPPGNFRDGISSFQVYTVKQASAGQGTMIYSDPATDKMMSIPSWIGQVLIFLLKYAFAPLLWLATFYRLKEKEI